MTRNKKIYARERARELVRKEQTVPYPVRIPLSHVKTLRDHNVDIPVEIRKYVAWLVSSLDNKKRGAGR